MNEPVTCLRETHGLRIAYVVSHPVSYHVGLYRRLGEIYDFTVVFFDQELVGCHYDAEFGSRITHMGYSVLEGYRCRELQSLRKSAGVYGGFFSRVNPGIFGEVGKYDVIIVHSLNHLTSLLALLWGWARHKKVIVRGEATVGLYRSYGKAIGRIRRLGLNVLVKFADAVLYSCSGNKEYWQMHGVEEDKLVRFPCAVDNDFFRPALGRRAHLDKSEPERPFEIIVCGKLIDRKRPLDVLDALALIPSATRANVHVTYAGDGPLSEQIKQTGARHGISVSITGLLNQEELLNAYAHADLQVLASEYDPSPKVLNEGMASGLPTIASSSIGTAPDLIQPGVTGNTFDPGDISALADYLVGFLADRSRARGVGKNAAQLVSEWSFANDVAAFDTVLKRFTCERKLTS